VLTYAMPDVTRSGVVGRPTTADAESGARLFDAIVDDVTHLLRQAREETEPMPEGPA
jgi:creatinine amidohydrolase